MTRFNRDLPRRLERDLSQISDRATPSSSTAWEAIQHRIDEQDSRAASGTERTMEVIMLDPETNKYSKRPRTGVLVAASVAALTLVGGLVVLANRDGERAPADRPDPAPTVPVTEPATAGDPAVVDEETAPVVVDPDLAPSTDAAAVPAPEGESDPDTEPEGEVLPQVEQLTQGAFVPTCATGGVSPDPDNSRNVVEQDCDIVGVGAQPFAPDQILELSLLENVGTEETPAGAFVSLGDNGFMNAGLLWDDGTKGRWVGIAEGVDEYENEPVFLSATSSQNADGSLDELDGTWWTTQGARPAFAGDEITTEIEIVCELVGPDTANPDPFYECTYDGDDAARFVPSSERQEISIIAADFGPTTNGPNSVLGSDFFVGTAGDGTVIRSGVVTMGTDLHWAGLRTGIGEFEGSLIAESGWMSFDDPGSETSTARGTIQLTVIPVGG